MYEKIIRKDAQCDLCGTKPRGGEIYRSDKFIYLCRDCLNKLDTMPVAMKENLEDYLMGNVV